MEGHHEEGSVYPTPRRILSLTLLFAVAAGLACGFHDGFGQRGVGVDGVHDFVFGGFEAFGEDEFGEHVGDFGAEHVGTEEFAVGFGEEEFDEAVGGVDGEGFSVGGEVPFADFVVEVLFFALFFGESDGGDLGDAVGAAGDEGVVHVAGFLAGGGEHFFDGDFGFHGGDVGEPGWSDDIAGGVDAFDGGLEIFADLEVAFEDFGLGVGGEEVFDVAGDADGDEDFVGVDYFLFVVEHVGNRDFDAFIGGFEFVGFGFGADGDAAFFEEGFEACGDFFIFDGEDAIHHFDEGDF